MKAHPDRPLIVLGMHRSATSFVAGALHKAGINMGHRLLPPGHGNEDGHYENIDFVELNMELLHLAGGNWQKPPPEDKIISAGEYYADEIKNTLQHNTSANWGWKDPRTTLTIPVYMPYLHDPILICCFRKPMYVAKSLKARDNMPEEKGLRLAYEYNKRLLTFLINWLEV